VLAVCGLKNSQSCRTYEALQKIYLVDVLDTWSCPNVIEYPEDSTLEIYACEQALLKSLRERLDGKEKLEAIVVDATAPRSMAQILIRIFMNRIELFAESPLIMTISLGKKETWRSIFVNRFRTDFFELEPVFKIDTLFQDSNTNIYVDVVVNDERALAVKNLREELARIEKRAGVIASVEGFMGGGPHYEEYFTPSRVYTPDDYESTSQSEQWSSQQPLEFQTILQLEIQKPKIDLSEIKVKAALEETISLLHSSNRNAYDIAQVHLFSNFGDGCVAIAIWSGGRIVISWDGRNHVDINLTIDDEDDEYVARFEQTFVEKIPSLKTILRDEHPRGYGRVVNFSEDIDEMEDEDPTWA